MDHGISVTQFSGTLFLTGSMVQTPCILYKHNSSFPSYFMAAIFNNCKCSS